MDAIDAPVVIHKDLVLNALGSGNKLKELREFVKGLYRKMEVDFDASVKGATLVANFTRDIDIIIRAVWVHCSPPDGAVLIASGGYGREELYPHSDIDLIILLPDNAPEELPAIEAFLQMLWDCRFDIGQQVLRIGELAKVCEAIETYTSFSEHRYLVGDKTLYKAFGERFEGLDLWDNRSFFGEKLREQYDRHAGFKNTIYNLEPNIKEAKGGLRDIHSILWMTRRAYGTHDLKKLVASQILTPEEARLMRRSHNFLKQLRVGLHLIAKRKEDRLLFDHQAALAARLGYQDRANVLAVEQLMRRYYQSAMTISILNNIIVLELIDNLSIGEVDYQKLNANFTLVNKHIGISDDRVFKKNPSNLFALFLMIARTPGITGIRPRAVRAIRAYIKNINREFHADKRNKEAFLLLFQHPEGLYTALRELNNSGVLARFIPSFSRIVGRMQYDLFHAYTVDAHTLFVIRNICDFINGVDHGMAELCDIAQQIERTDLLLIAAFFHDIAKGRGGDHSIKGERDARQFGQQFGLSNYDTSLIRWLVLHHLDMSTTAQKKDISDPAIVAEFAQLVGDQEHLDHLYLLTVADIRGTSPTLWNGWKRQLLYDLYQATTHQLKVSMESNVEHPNRIQSRIDDVTQIIQSDRRAADGFWQLLSEDYFSRTDIPSIAWHTDSILSQSAADIPLINVRKHDSENIYQIMVYAADVSTQLPLITSALSIHMLNIVDARIFRLKNNMMMVNFIIIDEDGSHLGDPRSRSKLLMRLKEHILTGIMPEQIRAPRSHTKHRYFDTPTTITISTNEGSNAVTVIELDTLDQPGLLYRVFKTIYELRLRLVSARVSTLGERVEDVFFVTDRDGAAIEDSAEIAKIESALYAALSTPLLG